MSQSLRIIFAGTPDFAARHLDALLSSEHQVVGVFTQPDRPAGRGKKLMPSPVKVLAEAHNLPVFQPSSLRPQDNQRLVADLGADIMVVVAYGLILPKAVLEMPRLGCINVHGSLLPRWRGAAPIQRSLWAGDSETGVTIMQMDVGLDTAILERGSSLLPKGIKIVSGNFSRGEVIRIRNSEGRDIAHGVSRYNSDALRLIAGQHSQQIDAILGYEYGPVAVHRDDMIIR